MAKEPTFDIAEAHKYFSAHCFNKTWDFIDQDTRTPDAEDEMLQACMASLWHWSQRSDATPQNQSVGFWQASRVFALRGDATNARRYAERSLRVGGDLEPFFVGYAYEALARAEQVGGENTRAAEYLAKAKVLCEQVSDAESKQMLAADLESLG